LAEAAIPLFKGEAMLLSWGDTSSRGKTVTFALHEDDCGESHPFRDLGTGKHGQRFALVAVPITDDERVSPGALDQAVPIAASSDTPANPKSGGVPGETKGGWYALKPSARAALLCKEVMFQHWAARTYGLSAPLLTEEEADTWLKGKIATHKKAWLNPDHPDHRPGALKAFCAIERAYRIHRGLETEAR
jgi:hypothetical protein